MHETKAQDRSLYLSPIGWLDIYTADNNLLAISIIPYLKPNKPPTPSRNTIATETIQQLKHYFKDPTFSFNLPIALTITPFQNRVLNACSNIPRGTVTSYGKLATALKTSPRAVGNACRHNPLPIIVPCHRIVGNQSFGGYKGATEGVDIAIKHWLLQHESSK